MRYSFVYIVITFLCSTFFLVFSPSVIAQTSLPIEQNALVDQPDVLVPGISCGIANSEKAISCCMTEDDIKEDKPPGLFEKVARKVGLGIISDTLQKKREFMNQLNELKRSELSGAKKCLSGEPQFKMYSDEERKCTCVDPEIDNTNPVNIMCKKYLRDDADKDIEDERLACVKCAQLTGYWSSVGCIPLNLSDLISKIILNVGIGLGGFVAVMCVTLNAIRLQLSRGDSNKIQSVRENMTSCILGLILILFSVFILRIVDVAILGGIFGGS